MMFNRSLICKGNVRLSIMAAVLPSARKVTATLL